MAQMLSSITSFSKLWQPLSSAATESEFVSDNQGNGIYSHVFVIDPRIAYTGILLLYLPNNQMEGSVLVASETLD